MAEERNFRSHYYEKMGFKSIDEKRSIETILKEDPIHIDKLRQFCLRFPIPAMYRIFVWKVLLGILPTSHDCQVFVMSQRQEQFDSLEHVLKIMRKINSKTPHGQILLKMFLIEEGTMTFQDESMFQDHGNQVFLKMAESICCLINNSCDCYWLTVSCFRSFRLFHNEIPSLMQKTEFYLKKEETGRKLFSHFENHDLWMNLPLRDWFTCCFAGVLPETPLQRVWDKVLGGSHMILMFVAVTILLTLHRPLLSMSSVQHILAYLQKIPEDTGDLVVTSAIDLWQKHGFHQVCGKSESPNAMERTT